MLREQGEPANARQKSPDLGLGLTAAPPWCSAITNMADSALNLDAEKSSPPESSKLFFSASNNSLASSDNFKTNRKIAPQQEQLMEH